MHSNVGLLFVLFNSTLVFMKSCSHFSPVALMHFVGQFAKFVLYTTPDLSVTFLTAHNQLCELQDKRDC